MSALVVSVHDVAPASFRETRRWTDQLRVRGVPAVHLVIPGPWRGHDTARATDLHEWLRERRAAGDEVAQHGWRHGRAGATTSRLRSGTGAVVCRGAQEFWGLGRGDVRRRLHDGRRVLTDAGFDVDGFTPPGWLADRTTLGVLGELGYRYTTSHLWVTDLHRRRRIPALALSHRPGGRTEAAGCRAMRAAAPVLARRAGCVRIALHPDDLASTSMVRAALAAIDGALDAGAVPMTYLQLLDRDRPDSPSGREPVRAAVGAAGADPSGFGPSTTRVA
ncbi:MAG: DUF2334 domain-containing protein [Actinomycetota bacterium]|nr:DUF2334 domain-containing protein [Actinomycetota bacterium]